MTRIGSNYRMYIYILKCADKTYYTGMTNDLEKRFNDHKLGLNKESYTYSRRPVELVYWVGLQSTAEAVKLEKQIKNWSRKKKEALIAGEFDTLQNEAKKKFD